MTDVWDVALSAILNDPVDYNEIHFAGPIVERGGKLLKGILRTGEWPCTPTTVGKLDKPLKVVRDGKSDYQAGIISLSELVENYYKKRPIKKVLIPFADQKNDDHVKDGNIARVNSGFVDGLFIEDDGDVSHLMAEVRFTDAEVEKKVREGSVDDVSSGIPFHPTYGAFLEHVALTPWPFMDDLLPWVALSDDAPDGVKNAEVVHHVLPKDAAPDPPAPPVVEPPVDPGPPPPPPPPPAPTDPPVVEPPKRSLSFRQVLDGALAALASQFNLHVSSYKVLDGTDKFVTVQHIATQTTWSIPYTIEDGKVVLAGLEEWKGDKEGETPPPKPAASTSSSDAPRTGDAELDAARKLREMRVAASAQSTFNSNGGTGMTVISREDLERLELSDVQRAAFNTILEDNATLNAKTKVGDVDARIEELKGWGFENRPGFLKLYRRIALSDDGGPAAVLLSDDGSDTKERVTALEILDKAIDALRGSENGKITFSDQHVESGNDNPPPHTDGPNRPVAERVQDAKDFLYPHGR